MRMKQAEEVVMYDSPEAATYRTDITGWVSRAGLYFGTGDAAETMARNSGCTHTRCASCGTVMPKGHLLCSHCRKLAADERYAKMPRAQLEDRAWLYARANDRYYGDLSEAEDDLEEGQTLADLQLVICEPIYARQIDEDFFQEDEDMDFDGELPAEVRDAVAAYNRAVSGIVLSWSPGKKALALPDERHNDLSSGPEKPLPGAPGWAEEGEA